MYAFTRKLVLTLFILLVIGLSLARDIKTEKASQTQFLELNHTAKVEWTFPVSPSPAPAGQAINLTIETIAPICEGDPFTLKPTDDSDEAYAYEWYEVLEDGTEQLISSSKQYVVYNVTTTTTFRLKGYYLYFEDNLIPNGDFGETVSDIDWGAHKSDYDLVGTGVTLKDEGTYFIAQDPSTYNNRFSNVGDHTTGTGNMFMANGSSNYLDRVWYRTDIPVEPNKIYAFTAWGKGLTAGSPAKLKFLIEGATGLSEPLGSLELNSDLKRWENSYVLWTNSSGATSVDIAIVNTVTNQEGKDNGFALDDISFAPMTEVVDEVEVKIHPIIDVELMEVGKVCIDEDVVLHANVISGDINTDSFQWMKDNAPIAESNVSINGSTLTINSFQSVNQGVYSFTMFNDCYTDTYNVDVLLKTLPVIDKQPVSDEVCVGEEAVFSVQLSGGTGTLQWYHNKESIWEPIDGETSEELRFTATLDDAGIYKCVVTDACTDLESDEVTLVVNENTVLTNDLVLNPICSGGVVTMEVEATGSGTLNYQWYKGATAISGATSEQYSFTATMKDDGATYYCVVSSSTLCGTAKSSIRTLEVNQSTVINTHPVDYVACVGGNHTFKVDALAENITYQWQVDGKDITGANSSSLVLNDIQLSDAGSYQCVVNGSCGRETSNIAVLSVHEITKITNTLPVLTKCSGADVTYTIVTEGTINKYTWLHNDVDQSVDQASFTLTGIDAADAGSIEVIVNGVCGSDSRETSLTVLPTTQINGPDPTLVCIGEPAFFSVDAVGDNLTYNWEFGGNSIGNQASLELSDVGKDDAGTYSVTVNGTCGPAITGSAILSVPDSTKIISEFKDKTACETQDVTFSVTATGEGNSYVWKKGGSVLIGETSSNLSLTNVTTGNSGLYRCEVTGTCGSDYVEARLDVYKNTAITTPLVDAEKCIGESASFFVVAEGDNLSYVWTKGGENQGINASTYTISNLTDSDVGTTTIEVTLTGQCGSLTSTSNLIVHPTTVITNGIDDDEVCVGEDKTFSVNAEGSNLSYQWQFNDKDILGETASTLDLTNIQTSDAGNYKCIVSGRCGKDETVASLTVNQNVTRIDGLTDQNICEGNDITLLVNFTGTDLQYEWKKDGGAIGSNQNTYSIKDLALTDAGTYTCRVYSPHACGDVTESMVLTVDPNTSITDQVDPDPVCEGELASFSVVAEGTGPFTYQWYEGTSAMAGEINATLNIAAVSVSDDGNTYYCKVKGKCSTINSSAALLTVNPNVNILVHPSSITVADGKEALFSVKAEGPPSLEYQWYEDDVLMIGETNSTLSITASETGNDGHQYHCVVTTTAGCNAATSDKAILTVDITNIAQEPESVEVCEGGSVVFVCKAEGDVDFEWRRVDDDVVMPSDETQELVGPPALWRSELTIDPATDAENGTQYKCIVKGAVVTSTSRIVTLTVNQNNTIKTEPTDQTVCPGDDAIFQIVADGSGTLAYEWFDSNGNSVHKERTLVLSGTDANAAITYYCQVSSSTGCESPTSELVNLNVYQETQIEPLDVSPVCVNGSKTFAAVAQAEDPITYSWTYNGSLTGWGDVASYSLDPVKLSDAGTYVVTVNGRCGSAQSSGTFQVKEYPQFTQILEDLNDPTKCEGEDLELTVDATGSDLVYTWFKDEVLDPDFTGKIYSLTNLSKANDAVTYRCEVSNLCETISTSTTLTLKTPVLIDPLLNDPYACEGDNVDLVANAVGDDLNYQWSKGGAPVGDNNSVFSIGPATLDDAGQYSVTVSGHCNEKTSSTDVTINERTVLTRGFEGGNYCVGDKVVLSVFAEGVDLHFDWTKDGESVFDDQKQYTILSATVDNSGHYKCVVTGECGDPIVVEADINVHPVTNITSALSPDLKCEGEEIILSTTVEGWNLAYVWTQDGEDLGVNSNELVLTNPTADQTGLYTMKVSGFCGSDVTSAPIEIMKNTELIKTLNETETLCEGKEIIFEVSALGHNLSYQWYYNGEPIDQATTNQYQISKALPDDSGLYMCKVNGSCGVPTPTSNLTVNPTTKILNGFGDTTICEGSSLSLDMALVGANLTYSWEKDGNPVSEITSSLNFPAIQVSNSGSYTATIIGTCGEVKNTAVVDVRPQLELLSQTGDQTVCEVEPSVNFEVIVSGDDLIYQWKKNGLELTGETNSVLIVSPILLEDAGNYVCEISSSCGDLITSTPAQLTVLPRAHIVLQPERKNVCVGSDIELSVEASGLDLTYQWRKDKLAILGAVEATYSLPNVTLADEGVYDCVVSSSCGPDLYSYEAIVSVEELPTSSILGRMELCAGEGKVLYQAPLDLNLSYSWTVDNGEIESGENTRFLEVNWNEADQGMLHLTVESLGNGCAFQVDSVINMLPLPNVQLAPFDTIGACHPSFELFGANIEGGIYYINGDPSRLFDVENGPGVYIINYAYTDENGCSASSKYQELVVDPLPVIHTYQDYYEVGVCETVRLSAQSSEVDYVWGPSNYLDATDVRTPLFTPGETQRLRVMVTDRFGCSAHDYTNVNVAQAPDIKTIADTTIGECQNIRLTTLNLGGSLESINWNFVEDLDQADILSPTLENPRVGNNYYRVAVEDPHGCVDRDSVMVTVVAAPDLGEDKKVCVGEEVVVNFDGAYKSLLWDDGFEGTTRHLTQVGSYHISAEDVFGCIDELEVAIHPKPIINLRDTFIFQGQFITLDPELDLTYGPYEYEWQDASIYPTFETDTEGRYRVWVRDVAGCESVKEITLEVKPPYVEVPNAFLPDGSGENSKFYVKDMDFIDDFAFYIYNRWGELVFFSQEIGYNGGWDGTHNGQKCPGATYVWMIISNGKMLKYGSVTLIR